MNRVSIIAAAAIFAVLAGATVAAGIGMFGWNHGKAYAFSANAADSNTIAGNYIGHGPHNNANTENRIANVVQCVTVFADSAAPIASNALSINLDVSAINTANANLQRNVSSGASFWNVSIDYRIFNNAFEVLALKALVAAHRLDHTQLQSLRNSLNPSVQILRSCVSTAGPNDGLHLKPFGPGRMHWPFRPGFHPLVMNHGWG